MTTLTIKTFAKKLGFQRSSDPRFRILLKQWEIEGAVKVYQGGYPGHSTAHPKKTLFTKSIEYFQETAARTSRPSEPATIGDTWILLRQFGFKVQTAASNHNCSVCAGHIRLNKNYASASYFISAKICSDCAIKLSEGEFTLNPVVKICRKKGGEWE